MQDTSILSFSCNVFKIPVSLVCLNSNLVKGYNEYRSQNSNFWTFCTPWKRTFVYFVHLRPVDTKSTIRVKHAHTFTHCSPSLPNTLLLTLLQCNLWLILFQTTNFRSFKLKGFADDNFKFDKNGIQMGRKHCGKRRNCSLRAIFSFSLSVFKRLVLQTCKNQG